MTAPFSDDALIALAQHLSNQAEREGATVDDYRELRGIFLAVLQRLREKVETTRNLVSMGRVNLADLSAWERMMAADSQNEFEDQLELGLTPP